METDLRATQSPPGDADVQTSVKTTFKSNHGEHMAAVVVWLIALGWADPEM